MGKEGETGGARGDAARRMSAPAGAGGRAEDLGIAKQATGRIRI